MMEGTQVRCEVSQGFVEFSVHYTCGHQDNTQSQESKAEPWQLELSKCKIRTHCC